MEIILDHTEYRNVQSPLAHQPAHHRHVSAPAVQQDQIRAMREAAVRIVQMCQPPGQRLTHTGIVIGTVHRADIEGRVLGSCQPAVLQHHHASRQMLTADVGYIIRLNALRVPDAQQLAQPYQ